jgi:hypothetical protein
MDQNEATKRELLALEQRYWNAIKAKDAATATSLSADPCMVVGAGNRRGRQGQFGPDDRGGALRAEDLLPGGRAPAARERRGRRPGLQVELEAYDSSVWVRRHGSWEWALHTESLAGDPFGRS